MLGLDGLGKAAAEPLLSDKDGSRMLKELHHRHGDRLISSLGGIFLITQLHVYNKSLVAEGQRNADPCTHWQYKLLAN